MHDYFQINHSTVQYTSILCMSCILLSVLHSTPDICTQNPQIAPRRAEVASRPMEEATTMPLDTLFGTSVSPCSVPESSGGNSSLPWLRLKEAERTGIGLLHVCGSGAGQQVVRVSGGGPIAPRHADSASGAPLIRHVYKPLLVMAAWPQSLEQVEGQEPAVKLYAYETSGAGIGSGSCVVPPSAVGNATAVLRPSLRLLRAVAVLVSVAAAGGMSTR